MRKKRPEPPEVDLLVSELMKELAEMREIGPHVDRAAGYLDAALFDPARDILSRDGKGFRARLLGHSWTLAGGRPGEMPNLLPVSIELLHAGSLVIDDIEDDSATRRGQPALHHRYGLPVALNTGNWLYFASMSCLSRLPCDDACRLGDARVNLLKGSEQGMAGPGGAGEPVFAHPPCLFLLPLGGHLLESLVEPEGCVGRLLR